MEGQPGKGFDLIVVESLDGNHIDLDGRETHPQGLFDPCPYPFKIIPSGDLKESLLF